jgi:hypothetical protein
VDLLIEDCIIEIKHISYWKHAIGQILCYALDFPNKQKVIYLFDYEKENEDTLRLIEQTCQSFDVRVEFFHE